MSTAVAKPGRHERIRVFEEVPELLRDLDDADAARLWSATARVVRLEPGPWEPDFAPGELRGHLGLLVIDGFLAREMSIGDAMCAELLGDGDVLRPWTKLEMQSDLDSAQSRWRILLPTRIVALDARFARMISPWPEVTAAVIDRVVQRARSLAFHLALCHIVQVRQRLLVLFWHLADRWGYVTPAGVKLPLPLSHDLLAAAIAARRPTVTTALTALRADNLVARTAEGWLLQGDPPVELEELRVRVTAQATTIGSRRPRAQSRD